MACQKLIVRSVQALENKINIQSVPVPHVEAKKHLGLRGKAGEDQKARK